MPSTRILHLTFTCALASLIACSSSSDEDAGVKDTGGGGMNDDGGGMMGQDATPNPDATAGDAMAPGPCNPFDGTGCPNSSAGNPQTCVWVVNSDQVQCREVAMPKSLELECSTTLLDCGPGLTCVSLMGDPNPTCHQTCSTMGGSPGAGVCNSVMGMSASYTCTGLQGKTYGVCRGAGTTCVPYMDTCGATETCTLQAGMTTTCEPAGMTARGADCSMSNCVKGSICIGLQGEPNPVCYEPCNPMAPACSTMGDVCLGLGGLSFGICRTPEMTCDPLNDMCPMGQVCSFNPPSVECDTEGTTPIGGDCSSQNCARGGVCVFLQGEANPKCYEPCNLMTPMCSAGQCGNIGLSFGICN